MKLPILLALMAVSAESNQIVVPTFSTSGVDPNVAPVVTELVLEALLNRHGLRALGPGDIKDLLTVEQQKQLMGCDQSSCMAELAGAMGAKNMVSGMVGKLGDTFVVTLKLVDTESAKVSARASRRFPSLDRAPDAVGPLVDDLLNAKPRVMTATPQVLVEKKAAPRPAARSVRDHCEEAVPGHTKLLASAGYSARLVAARKTLLEDLLHTAFREELARKVACIDAAQASVEAELANQRLASKTAQDAQDVDRRRAEWDELRRQVGLLVEAYDTGLAKEKNGTGVRPTELPFPVVARAPELRRPTAAAGAYADAVAAASAPLRSALEAVQKNDKRAFVALWTSDRPRSAKDPRDVWIEVLRDAEQHVLDPCPVHIMDDEVAEQRARLFAEKRRVETCVRLVNTKSGRVRVEPVVLERVGSAWQLATWKPLEAK